MDDQALPSSETRRVTVSSSLMLRDEIERQLGEGEGRDREHASLIRVQTSPQARFEDLSFAAGRLLVVGRRPDDPGEQLEPLVDSRALSLDQEADRVSTLEQRRVLGRDSREHSIGQ